MFNRLYSWYGKKVVLSVATAICVLFVVGLYLYIQSKDVAQVPEVAQKPTVTVTKVGDLGFASSFEAIGTVQAVSEATLQTEAGGRITSVTTEIGKNVGAGAVLATIENSRERAILLQAQGAYEAALAGAQSGTVSVTQAESGVTAALNNAVNVDRSAYTTVSNVFYTKVNTILDDAYITSPGVILIDSELPYIKAEGRAFEDILPLWQTASAELTTTSDIDATLASSKQTVERTLKLVDSLIRQFNTSENSMVVAGATIEAQIATFTSLRAVLNGSLASIEGAQVGLKNARDVQKQAQIAGSSNVSSASSAQVKIALGSLRGAQANYEKTLVRTPIAGVVNALYLKAGEYVTQGQKAAIVANNNGLQIVTGVSEEDRGQISIGDIVRIDKVATGTVTAIGGAVDPTTGKVAVKVSVENNSVLQNGTTVSLTFTQATAPALVTTIVIPLSSIKMTGSGPVAFSVDATSKLIALPLTLGTITGDSVAITAGLTQDSAIVTDARGLKEGQEVTVITK